VAGRPVSKALLHGVDQNLLARAHVGDHNRDHISDLLYTPPHLYWLQQELLAVLDDVLDSHIGDCHGTLIYFQGILASLYDTKWSCTWQAVESSKVRF
jgi:hypothetical protein